MNWMLFVYGVVPLVAFVLVDLYAGMRWAVGAAVVFALVDIGITYKLSGTWDPGSIVAAVLIAGLGVVTWRRQDPIYVKFQPVAVAGVFALLLIYFQLWGGGIIQRYLPLLEPQLPADVRPMLANPGFVATMDQAVTGLIFVLVVHGAWVAYAALKMSNTAWLLVRALGFWAVFGVYMVGFSLYLSLA